MIAGQRKYPLYVAFATGLVILVVADIAIGSVPIPLIVLIKSFFSTETGYSEILWQFRLPKALTCILAGSALGASGLLMQTLFRNPLAGPDVLGLSSGASLFVALLLLSGQSLFSMHLMAQPWSIAGAATLGSGVVFLLVMAVSKKITDNTSLLIIGLMIAAVVSAIVGVLQFISRADDLQAFMIWTLGSVGSTNWTEIAVLAIMVLSGFAISLGNLKAINSLLLGENYAHSLGIKVRQSRFWIVTATSLMAGGVTAFCGPIAFVGLAVPHLVRLVVSTTNHKVLLPLVMMAGSMLLLFCDLLAQLPGTTQLLPLNAITSIIGAPVVIWVVIRNKKIRL
jgi:iron complex transport system permease protein